MRYHAESEQWIPAEIKGVRGYFSDSRINRDTVPDRFHFWELADEDSSGMPCRYKPSILVNFCGTFITASDLPVDNSECRKGFISADEEWKFTDSGIIRLRI